MVYAPAAGAAPPKAGALPPEPLQLQPLSPAVPAPSTQTKTTAVTTETKAVPTPPAASAAATKTTTVESKTVTTSAPVIAPTPAPAAVPPAATPTVASTTPPAVPTVQMGAIVGDVRDVRVGDHIDKTRIVLDVSAKGEYKATLDTGGRRLIIQLPQYNWKTAAKWNAVSANLVSNYTYANGVLVMDLLAPASIRSQTLLPTDAGGQRLVLDLFAPGVHVE